MVLLTQRKQLGLKVEDVEGTAETITSSELVTVLNPSATINLNNIRRPVLRGTFSKLASGTGIRDATITYDQEFAGPVGTDPAAVGPAPIDTSLRACGFRRFDVWAVEITSMTGQRTVVGDVLIASVGGTAGSGALVRVAATFKKDTLDDGQTETTPAVLDNHHSDILFFEVISGAIVSTDTQLHPLNPNLAPFVSHALTTPVLVLTSQTPDLVGDGWVPTSTQSQIIEIGTVALGPFTAGEIIAQVLATSPNDIAFGQVIKHDTVASPNTIEYIPLLGSNFSFQITNTPPGKVIGQESGANADIDVAPVSLQNPSATARLFEDGIRKTLAGTRGSCTMTFPTGEFPLLNVSLQGSLTSVADVANLSVGGATQAAVPTFLGIEFRVHRDWIPCTANISIDMGQNLVRRTCAGNASGLEGFIITDRTPTLTMDPEAVAEAIGTAYLDALAATPIDIQLRFGVFATGSGIDTWLISMDQVQYESLNSGDRDGIITHDATMQINSYSTVDEAEISIINYSRTLVELL